MAQIPTGYYDPASGLSGDALKTALNNIIKGHTEYPYTSTATDVWDILKVTDPDPNNSANVQCIYTGWSFNGDLEYDNGTGWSREHIWPQSRGNFTTDAAGIGTDVHNLRPEDISVNSARSNRWYSECSTPYLDDGGTIYTGCFSCSAPDVWEPRPEVKGDVARIIFYMATRYEGLDGELDLEIVDYFPDDASTEPIFAKLSDLLAWHAADPVDAYEINRNNVIYSFQHNRNPFIDHPEYVSYIWGDIVPEPDPNPDPEPGAATELFFTEYIEGSSYNKALEVSNFTGLSIDLSQYTIKKQTNGVGDWTTGFTLSGTLATGQSHAIVYTSASSTLLAKADMITNATEMTFNGNDIMGLFKNGVLIDIIGVLNVVTNYAIDVTLIRNSNVVSPVTTYNTSQWTTMPIDYFDNLGIHTFDGTTPEPETCNVPSGLASSAIAQTTATVSWATVTGAVSYNLQYRIAGTSTWTTKNTTATTYNLTTLTANTQYEFQVQTVCSTGTSAFSSSAYFSTLEEVIPEPVYCVTKSSTKYEWIANFTLGTINNTTGASLTGYSDYTNLSATLTKGSTYSAYFKAAYKSTYYTEYWTIWIDYNKDGDFDDLGEKLGTGSSKDILSHYITFTVPTTAITGTTRLRINMNDVGYYTACTSNKYGETEDYTVNLGVAKSGGNNDYLIDAKPLSQEVTQNIAVWPTITSDFINIRINYEINSAQVKIYSLDGRIVNSISTYGKETIDVSNLPAGVYFININDGSKISTYKFIKN